MVGVFFLNYVVKLLSFYCGFFDRYSSVGERIVLGIFCRYVNYVCVAFAKCFFVV